ncbi:MAG: hypothetical protein QW514_05520 [Thermoprotei archaeon]
MMRKVAFVEVFAILWVVLTPLAIHLDYPLADSLGTDVKTYYIGLYVLSNLVLLLVVLANIDRRIQEGRGGKPKVVSED